MASALVTVASVSTSSVWFKVNVVGTNVNKNMEWTPNFAHDDAAMQDALLTALISFCLASLGITVTGSDIIIIGAPMKLAAL